ARNVTGVQTCALPILDAGSRILYAPTFQAQPAALREAGMEARTEALNARLVQLTRRAAGPGVWVAGDLATMAASLESFRPENFRSEERRVGRGWRCET